ncbi:MAG: hypothetical protein U5L10_00970 [Candidatus Moranbacteria bacterium]|nr:hypothetical protein [Candidatus Moranbacteria bacterium]
MLSKTNLNSRPISKLRYKELPKKARKEILSLPFFGKKIFMNPRAQAVFRQAENTLEEIKIAELEDKIKKEIAKCEQKNPHFILECVLNLTDYRINFENLAYYTNEATEIYLDHYHNMLREIALKLFALEEIQEMKQLDNWKNLEKIAEKHGLGDNLENLFPADPPIDEEKIEKLSKEARKKAALVQIIKQERQELLSTNQVSHRRIRGIADSIMHTIETYG